MWRPLSNQVVPGEAVPTPRQGPILPLIVTYESGQEISRYSYRTRQPRSCTAKGENPPKFDPGLHVAHAKPSSVGHVAVSPVPLVDRAQAAAYVAALTGELATLVRRHRLDTLGYFLDMARLEAEEILQGRQGNSPALVTANADQPSAQRK